MIYSAALRPALAEAAVDVVNHHLLEIGGERRAAQGRRLLAVDEHRRDTEDVAAFHPGARPHRGGAPSLTDASHEAPHEPDAQGRTG
jgi:hypothetical protein